MNARKIRIGVAGLGRIGWEFHARTLSKHADFSLVAVADTDANRRREAEQSCGCAAYAAFDDMVADGELEAVVVATPTHLHRDMAVRALRAGLHVLIEKPMAASHADASAIVRAAADAHRVLTTYQPGRLAASFQHLLRIVCAGRIGRVCWAQRGMFNYARRNDWQSLREFGGGMLNNYGAHGLDQLLQLVGYDVERVFCQMQIVASLGDAEDVVKAVFTTAGGAVGQLDINQASAVRPYELTVWGTVGAIVQEGKQFHLRAFDPANLPPKELDRSLASARRQYPSDDIPFVEETIAVDASCGIDVYANLAGAIRDGAPVAVPPQETLAVVQLMERCRESAGNITRMPG